MVKSWLAIGRLPRGIVGFEPDHQGRQACSRGYARKHEGFAALNREVRPGQSGCFGFQSWGTAGSMGVFQWTVGRLALNDAGRRRKVQGRALKVLGRRVEMAGRPAFRGGLQG